ncbi:multidrug/biocide efflux PACE transporter [Alcaligenes endophyticus]|uniref:Multidrug/biocide efflux PACE transporter n=1 Tax=Alcaligenes endophyticus TaxID=1929088 RepID=A0ABT8EIV3_9BURK|nr:multidrug/biocide efflux PACE transporter [Alcaligenes endophyticus]MCX5592597.1 multidrug/biocide efflux PACE transporter [Alcaligenes endophyticus]MDN4121055.1 multidrug/biocide efflux PACE transporter [Alcaligenes endophyticus]
MPPSHTPSLDQPVNSTQNTHLSAYQRSVKERLFHAVLFEILGIAFATPLAMWLTGKSAGSMAALSAVISGMATLWNMIFNWVFDRLQQRMGFERTMMVRLIHACSFELGLIVLVVPVVAWWINSSLWQALILDIGLVLFFLPYTFIYNLIYDKVRTLIVARRRYTTKQRARAEHAND